MIALRDQVSGPPSSALQWVQWYLPYVTNPVAEHHRIQHHAAIDAPPPFAVQPSRVVPEIHELVKNHPAFTPVASHGALLLNVLAMPLS